MKREAIALRIHDDGARSVGTDLMFLREHFAAIGPCGFDRFIEATFDGEVNERAMQRC